MLNSPPSTYSIICSLPQATCGLRPQHVQEGVIGFRRAPSQELMCRDLSSTRKTCGDGELQHATRAIKYPPFHGASKAIYYKTGCDVLASTTWNCKRMMITFVPWMQPSPSTLWTSYSHPRVSIMCQAMKQITGSSDTCTSRNLLCEHWHFLYGCCMGRPYSALKAFRAGKHGIYSKAAGHWAQTSMGGELGTRSSAGEICGSEQRSLKA